LIGEALLISHAQHDPCPTFERFCDAMINIRQEAEEVITGKQPRDNNVLKNAPHPISVIALSEDEWNR
jgi:glycine dehydrogenase